MALFSFSKNTLFKTIAITTIWAFIEEQLSMRFGPNQFISLIRYFLMLSSSFVLIRYTKRNHQSLSVPQFLLLLWIAILYITAIPHVADSYDNHYYFKQFISIYFFLYLIPLYMIADVDIETIKKLFALSYKLIIVYLVLAIPIYLTNDKLYYSESLVSLLGGASILLMTLPYHNNSKGHKVMWSLLVAIVIMMLLGRRNKVLYLGSIFFFAGLLNVFGTSTLTAHKNNRLFFILVAIVCGLGLVIFNSSFDYFFSRVDTGMQSREDIIELFFLDFNSTPNDWIFGRGIYGEFMGGALATSEDTGMRVGIENGYLNIILKGGGIWLALLILISLRSVFLGLFKSNNKLCKGFAFVILIYYIDMIGFGIATISLSYIMIFLGISICNNKQLRACTDEKLKEEIGLK